MPYPPNSKLTRLVDATVEPITLAQAKLYLRVEVSADDDMISDMISAARIECERIGDRSYVATTWQLTLDYLPFPSNPQAGFPFPFSPYNNVAGGFNRVNPNDGGITLPMSLLSLVSITYVDMAGELQSIDPSQVIVSPGKPGRIYPAYGTFFPFSQPRAQAVTITYVGGYDDDGSTVPANIRQAMRLILANMYAHRTCNVPLPDNVTSLIVATEGWNYA